MGSKDRKREEKKSMRVEYKLTEKQPKTKKKPPGISRQNQAT